MEKTPLQAIVLVTSLGLQFAVSLVFGFFIGSYFDSRLGTGQTFMIAGVLLGLLAGIIGSIKLVKPFIESDK